jgi:parallel beta-helix repeat protein
MKQYYAVLLTAMILLLSACALSPVSHSNESGTTYYVATGNGSDNNTGTSARPFKTVGKAAGVVKPGDTVIVRTGTYTEIVELGRSGTAQAWITFKANPGDRVIVKNNSWWGNYSNAFDIKANYIHIEGFEVTGNNQNEEKGISIYGTEDQPLHHIRIWNNIVHDCGGSGIAVGFADYVHIKGNIVYRNSWWSKHHESGINLFDNRALDNKAGFHSIIEDNISFDNDNKLPEMQSWFETPNDQWTDGNGIIIDWCRDEDSSTLIRNNICFNNGGRGIQITNSVNTAIVNNTLYMNSINARSNGDIGNGNGSKNTTVLNNILYARKGKECLGVWEDSPNCFYDYNLYYNEAGTILVNGNIRQTENVFGTHGVHNILNQNPLFGNAPVVSAVNADESTGNSGIYPEWKTADYSVYDFSLKADSPAINAGNAEYSVNLGAKMWRE